MDKVSSWHQRNGCSFLGFIAVVGCLCRSAKKMLMFISTFFSNFIEILTSWVYIYMGVSKNRGTPKWMVYNGKPY